MDETLSIETERMDDIPLLMMQMRQMHLAALLDRHIPTHGHRKGVSVGELCEVWLTHILSQADHRMNRVQEWGSQRLSTLRGCGMPRLSVQDLTDDRLADVLRLLSNDEYWRAFEQEWMGQLVRVYDLSVTCVRIDTTTASSYAEVNEQGLLKLGHSKDHRPDLPQLKLALASLDPLGMPLATEVVSGERADDPLYLPVIARVRSGLQKPGVLYVGDCKMAALQTRASLAVHGDFYLCPLSALQAPPKQMREEVTCLRAQQAPLIQVCRENDKGESKMIAQGYETVQTVTAEVDGVLHTWQERRLLVQSLAAAHAAGVSLQERVKKAQQSLGALTARRQGKARLTERKEVEEAITAILNKFRVQGLLQVEIDGHEHARPVRAYRGRLREECHAFTFTLVVARNEGAINEALSHLGWRVYATNQSAEYLSLEHAVEAYRDEYLVERNFSRLKGHPLSLTPLYVQRDDHRIGLVRLLTLALRVLTVLEGIARQRLAEKQEELAGLFAGNPKRYTAHPTAERLLEAFGNVTLTVVSTPRSVQRHVTPLSPLQQQILTLLGFSPAVYIQLADASLFGRHFKHTVSSYEGGQDESRPQQSAG